MIQQRSLECQLTRQLSDNIGRLLVDLAKHFQHATLNKLHQRGHSRVRISHSAAIGNLGLESLRLTELAQRGGITQQAMGKLVKELERIGYIQRTIDEHDKRARDIRLTPRGIQLLNDCFEVFEEVRAEYADALGPDALDSLEQQLRSASHTLGIR